MKRLIRIIATIVTICTLLVNMVFANSELLYETDSGVGGFVARLYNVALDRDYDINGYNDWCTKLVTGEMNGADVAFGFLFSDEFINKNYSNEEYVNILYSVFFDRGADQQGFNDWVGQLNNGVSRQSVLSGFINSTEWANVCISFGIISGGNANATVIPEASEGTIGFVTRLYELCLGRSPDPAGLEHWTSVLTSQEQTAKEVAYGFIFSDEFANRYASLSSTERIVLFYNVFLNRQPDASSSSWEGAASLDGYEGRRQLFIGFADSTEFRNICAEYGVICGASISLPHVHEYYTVEWTEDVVDGHMVEVYVCDCNIEWATIDECMAHQIATPQCGGWCNNNKWVETITQIIHHYRECACGAREDID